ncbi:hypothetical protein [Streptomyces adustus]|uniref:hypothetical protein n=1 Tax=Streptomyces adustus TaxID=1609272 RepID=UPI00192E6D44|nr:hypothetical protein [Streptomyces adustus]
MTSSQDPSIEQARATYDSHMRTCRQCGHNGVACPAAKHLLRIYNNVRRNQGR